MKINKLLGLIATSTIVATPLCVVSCSEKETKTWNVSFDTKCETFINTERVNDGEPAHKPEDPKRDGYDFGGWYTDESFEEKTKYTFGTAVTSDLILYAKWTESDIPTGDKISISESQKQQTVDNRTRTATYVFAFNGENETNVSFELSTPSENIVLKQNNAKVEDGNFSVSIIYVPTPINEKTFEFGLNFSYTVDKKYVQEISGLKALVEEEPIIPTASIEFDESEVWADDKCVATFKGTWSGDLPVNNKFDKIHVLLSQPQNDFELEIIEPEKVIIDENNEFEIKILYVGASPTHLSQQSFSLNFEFTQGKIQSSLLVNNLKVKHQGGEEPTDEGYLYLYNGSSVLYGQTGVAGYDPNAWYCYYFENKTSMGVDVTDKTTFLFQNSTGTGITINDKNQVSWDDTLESGMYWGFVKAMWTNDDGETYSSQSNEIIVNMCDFIIWNEHADAFNYTVSKSDSTHSDPPADWKCTFNGIETKELRWISTTELHVIGGYDDCFDWNSVQNRINILWGIIDRKSFTYPKTFTMYLTTTYEYHGYTFEAKSDTISITIEK